MPAAKIDLTIEQGTTYRQTFTWQDANGVPIDITGWTARMQIRATKESVTFLEELTTANAGIVIGGITGTVEIVITSAKTTAYAFAQAVYDLELIDTSSEITRFLEGRITISYEVTR